MIVTDAQVHVWAANTPERPWPAGGELRAQRPAPLGPGDLLEEMDRAGVARAVLVPPSWEGDRNDLALEASRTHPDRFAVMGRLDASHLASPTRLLSWRDQPGMLGIRLTFHLPGQGREINAEALAPIWSSAAAAGVPAMVYAPGHIDALATLARSHPDLRLIVDHLALPETASGREVERTIAELLPMADLPNVAVKVSALPCHTAESFPFPGLQTPIRTVVGAFGAERCLWGSDLSRLPCTYEHWVRTFEEPSLGLTDDERGWIMSRSAETWLGWPVGR